MPCTNGQNGHKHQSNLHPCRSRCPLDAGSIFRVRTKEQPRVGMISSRFSASFIPKIYCDFLIRYTTINTKIAIVKKNPNVPKTIRKKLLLASRNVDKVLRDTLLRALVHQDRFRKKCLELR